jgi:Putative serine esterase (DUF676)
MDDNTALIQISGGDQPDRLADVIFVHGLDGNARTTWHPRNQPDDFWPAWLGEDMPQLGVWSLSYAVSASAWKGHTMPLYDRANNTLDLLELEAIGRRPLAFICHSLGGLLIKQVLRNARDAANPSWHAIVQHTQLLVFLSTPHSGANLASWIKYIGTLLRTTVSVEELEMHHPRLRELNDWYRDQVESLGIKTFVYYETRPTSGILVVDATTANPGLPGVRPIPVDEDHMSICKPASKQDRLYRRVKRLLEDTVLHVDSASRTPTAPIGEVKIEVCRRLLADWHDLADYFAIPADQRHSFTRGREPQGVWEWLEARSRLPALAEALAYIGRVDLVEVLQRHPR